ncbi:hypothetical protein HK103_000910 [Boothiomyces macroporosus]|uniref:FIST domain-containing protein n=1 Tax=Boothiomyces macroporosus TaxID=261099 RepID=A0AAD5Y7B0_9FUNG|nr:hypothetical protein HK103_000910 [Boothiomyces macroporosus]
MEIAKIHQGVYNKFKPRYLIGGVVDSPGVQIHSLKATGFYSPPGITRKQKSVGRWHNNSDGTLIHNSTNFSSISQRNQDINKSVIPNVALNGCVFTISDNEPYDLMKYITGKRIGLVGSRTPFLNGNPFTLFYNNKVKTGGSVGIVYDNSNEINVTHRLNPISKEFTITKCLGNMILNLDSISASKTLIEAYKDQPDQMHCKITFEGKSGYFNILGGDLTKGSIAIDTMMDLKPQSTIQFMTGEGISGLSVLGLDLASEVGVYCGGEGVLDGFQFTNVPTVKIKI